jgi:hypothetical protein
MAERWSLTCKIPCRWKPECPAIPRACVASHQGKKALDAHNGQKAGFEVLDIAPAHAAAVEVLDRLHCDPFDRIFIAQAMTAPLRLRTRDRRVAACSDSIIAA